MTLYNILSKVPGNGIVTVADYLTGEIYIDCKQTFEIIEKNDAQWHRYHGIGLKTFRVYRIEIGNVHGDLIVSVLED